MSGEYYCIEEVAENKECYGEYDEKETKVPSDYNQKYNSMRDDAQSTTSKRSQDCRLHEIEEQLEIAENRCNTLKVQLESMKQTYHRSNSPKISPQRHGSYSHGNSRTTRYKDATKYNKKRAISSTRRSRQNPEYTDSNVTVPHKSSTSSDWIQHSKRGCMTPMVRQNSTSIGTDRSGAAVRTINNILTGITHSVNRLAKFHSDNTDEKTNTKNASNDECSSDAGFKHPEQHQRAVTAHSIGVQGVILENSKTKSRWSRHTSSNAQPTKIQPLLNPNKQNRSSAKHGNNITKQRTVPEIESQSALTVRKRKRPLKRLKQASKSFLCDKTSELLTSTQISQIASSNLIELYHNIAAKSSDSDSALGSKSVTRQKGGGELPVPSIDIPSVEQNQPTNKQILSTINENGYSDINGICNGCHVTVLTKNYALPTIASRMKKVNKQFFNTFSFRSIPFCAAKSITPSHNIGLNIQQVMNILKTKQPVTGISPTLAHNIGLAAGKLESCHLSTLVSTLSTKLGYVKSQCPLTKTAKPIENGLSYQCSEPVNGLVADNGPCGDREETFPQAVWSIDPEKDKRCTCSRQKGVSFRQVLHKYQMASDYTSSRSKSVTGPPRLLVTKTAHPNKALTTSKKQRIKNWIKNDIQVTTENIKTPQEVNGKEQNLKVVLKNLHDEFELLNNKYEDLAKEVANSQDPNAQSCNKDLEVIEAELNKKEEEINMVMSLYKEVVALKDQVKKLKEKTSQPTISVSEMPYNSASEVREPKTVQHLTQLLKQIQNYQLHYKNKM